MSIPGSARTRSLAGSGRSFVGPPEAGLLRTEVVGETFRTTTRGGDGTASAPSRPRSDGHSSTTDGELVWKCSRGS